jgi:2-hydroxychromene-2-carboxylate isomerase
MAPSDAAFYFDLASPLAYLAAEQVLQLLPGPAQWQPVLARDLQGDGWGTGSQASADKRLLRVEIERGAIELGLQRVRWPSQFPFDSEAAMRVATYAKSIGRTVPFAQAAFRQAFAGGHSLENIDFVLIAAAACEMHPRAVLQSIERDSVRRELALNTTLAANTGVRSIPAIRIGGHIFEGAQALSDASEHLQSTRGKIG